MVEPEVGKCYQTTGDGIEYSLGKLIAKWQARVSKLDQDGRVIVGEFYDDTYYRFSGGRSFNPNSLPKVKEVPCPAGGRRKTRKSRKTRKTRRV